MRVLQYFEWLPLTTLTENGNTRDKVVCAAGVEKITLFIDIYDATGTSPTLDLYIDTKDDFTGNWYEIAHVGTFTAGSTSMHTVNVDGGQCFALRWVLGGTNPSFELKIAAEFRGD